MAYPTLWWARRLGTGSVGLVERSDVDEDLEDVMTRMRRMMAIGMVAGLALVGAACGGDDGASSLQGQVATEFTKILPLDGEQSNCLAGKMIEVYGADEMQRFVDDPQNFVPTDEASSETTVQALSDCGIDPVSLVEDRVQTEGGEIELEPIEDPTSTTAAP